MGAGKEGRAVEDDVCVLPSCDVTRKYVYFFVYFFAGQICWRWGALAGIDLGECRLLHRVI